MAAPICSFVAECESVRDTTQKKAERRTDITPDQGVTAMLCRQIIVFTAKITFETKSQLIFATLRRYVYSVGENECVWLSVNRGIQIKPSK